MLAKKQHDGGTRWAYKAEVGMIAKAMANRAVFIDLFIKRFLKDSEMP